MKLSSMSVVCSLVFVACGAQPQTITVGLEEHAARDPQQLPAAGVSGGAEVVGGAAAAQAGESGAAGRNESTYAVQPVDAEVTTQVTSGRSADLVCLENPSFEGTPAINLALIGAPAFQTAPWQACEGGSPDIWNETLSWFSSTPGPKANDGATYLQLYHVPVIAHYEWVSQALCKPLAQIRGDAESMRERAYVSSSRRKAVNKTGSLGVGPALDDSGNHKATYVDPKALADFALAFWICRGARHPDERSHRRAVSKSDGS